MRMIRLWSCEHSVSELVCPLYPLFFRRKEAGSWGLGINLFLLLLFLQATSLPRTNDLMVIGCDPRKKRRKKKLVPPPRAPDPPLGSAEAGAAAASQGGQCNKRTMRKEIHQ